MPESTGGGAARAAFDAGKATWPNVDLSLDDFARYFSAHAASDAPPETHAADMYLACACSLGNDAALVALERGALADVARAVATIDSSEAFVQEILQATRERLLVRAGGAPSKMAEYGGRASLRSWLSAVAVRWAIGVRRRKAEQRHEAFDADRDERLARATPELEYLRGRYKAAFETALHRAIGALPPKERMLLRLNVVDGLSVDKLATLYNVGRSTAARWLAAARTALLEEAREALRRELGLSASEIDSLAADLRSQLDVSLLRLLEQQEQL